MPAERKKWKWRPVMVFGMAKVMRVWMAYCLPSRVPEGKQISTTYFGNLEFGHIPCFIGMSKMKISLATSGMGASEEV